MMEAELKLCTGERFTLPPLLSWEITLTGGVPCDSFSLTCPCQADAAKILARAVGITMRDREPVLQALVDEYEIVQDERGRTLTVSGRGMLARMLDNEAEAAVYLRPTLSALLRRHAAACGLRWKPFSEVTAAAPYTVASGSSQWKALSDFTRFAGGFTPRINRDGVLEVTPWRDSGERLAIGEKTPLLRLSWRERHYGVYSEVLVVDKVTKARTSVKNQEFLARGGQCRRVLYTPGQSTAAAMRYTGEYQIGRSRRGARQLTAALPGRLSVRPGEVVNMERGELGITGEFYVEAVTFSCRGQGERTVLTMRRLKDHVAF